MAKNFKKTIAFIFYLLAGIIVGGVISHFCNGNAYLGWLAYGKEIGISAGSPMVIDLIIFKLVFGFAIKATVAQIFTVPLAIFLYSKASKHL